MQRPGILVANIVLVLGYSLVLILIGRRMIDTLETQIGILGVHVLVLFLLGAYHRETPVGLQYGITAALVILVGVLLLVVNFISTLSTLV